MKTELSEEFVTKRHRSDVQVAAVLAIDQCSWETKRVATPSYMGAPQSLHMAIVLKSCLDFLRGLHFGRGFIGQFFRRWTLVLASFGRRLGVWCGKRGTFGKDAYIERLFPGIGARLHSKEYVINASYAPASASRRSLQDLPSATAATGQTQLQAAAPSSTTPPVPTNLTVDARQDRVYLASVRSSANLSVYSRASNRHSIARTYSRESLYAPTSHPTRFPRAPHRQFGRGPSPSPSRERPSRSPSPTSRVHDHQLPRLEIDVTNLQPPVQIDGRNSPIKPPSNASHSHTPLSPPSLHGHRRRLSSTSVVVIVNPSTDSLPLSPSTNQLPLTDEPYTIGSPISHPSPVADVPGVHEGSPQHSLITSSISAIASSNLDLPEGRVLQLIHSEQVPRYTKDVTVLRERTAYEIPPLTTTFHHISEQIGLEQGSLREDCSPWEPATHPDGALYFFDRERRLFTDTDMHSRRLRQEMEYFYDYLQRILQHDGVDIPSTNYDLALDIMPTENEKIQWSYYYACHETRCLFWLDPYDATHMLSELFGVKSPAHVKHRLEALYWTHWSFFPVVFEGRRLVPAVYDELVGILSHGCMDVMTSKSSTLPYDADTMQQMIRLVRNAKGSDIGLVYHTAAITRLLSFFAHWRFLYFHGQNSARLEREKTIYANSSRERTLLITLLSPVLFLAPEVHLRELEKLWTDEVIIETVWKSFMEKLLHEWGELILWSTVMLTANVGFLAIPGVVISNLNSNIMSTSDLRIFTSTSQVASCMSVEASVGSIVIGMLLVRHNRTKQKEDPAGASDYLDKNTHRIFGLEPMAIIFSLPWALLMWAMATFSIALLLFCFSISNPSTRIFVAVTSVMVAALIGWCIRSAWESSDERGAWHSSLLPSVTRALGRVRVTFHKVFNFRLPQENPSSFSLAQASTVRALSDREGTEEVVV